MNIEQQLADLNEQRKIATKNLEVAQRTGGPNMVLAAEEEIEVLQAYSKEVSRRLPEFTKSRAAVEASVKEEDSSERDGRGAGGRGAAFANSREQEADRSVSIAAAGAD